MTKRVCQGTTKVGKPCGANPLKPGTVLEGVAVTGKWCVQHDPDLPDSARIGGAQPGAGRKPLPRTVDLMRQWVEEHPEAFGVIKDALKAERAIVVGNTKDAYVEYVPDWPTRIVAFRELMDRAYGRPKQSSEVTVVTDDQLVAEIERMERELASNDPDRGAASNDPTLQGATGEA